MYYRLQELTNFKSTHAFSMEICIFGQFGSLKMYRGSLWSTHLDGSFWTVCSTCHKSKNLLRSKIAPHPSGLVVNFIGIKSHNHQHIGLRQKPIGDMCCRSTYLWSPFYFKMIKITSFTCIKSPEIPHGWTIVGPCSVHGVYWLWHQHHQEQHILIIEYCYWFWSAFRY